MCVNFCLTKINTAKDWIDSTDVSTMRVKANNHCICGLSYSDEILTIPRLEKHCLAPLAWMPDNAERLDAG